MYCRLSLRLLCFLLSLAVPAAAQFTRDNAANKKIDEAVNDHYLATDFDKAEGVLTGTITACADKCSPQVLGKAWMYVGIVRGSGKNDQTGAKEAFQKAIALDPQVKLDSALATPETQKTFDNAGGTAGAATPDPPPKPDKPDPAAAGAEGDGAGGMRCTPAAMEIQTRRPIPVECFSDEEAASVELRYKPFGAEWKTLKMTKKGDGFRAEVPCLDTKIAGDLKVYARAKDAAGETLDNWGSKNKPINFGIGESVAGAPPTYQGEAAPARCGDSGDCPPDFPGCGDSKKRGDVDWGGPCENSTQCKSGLLCGGGVCETAPSCDTDADCTTGKCVAGKCDVGDGEGEAAAAGPYKKNWLGLHYGVDVAIVGGTNVCGAGGGYECYTAGSTTESYAGPPYPGTGIKTGTAVATQRIMLSYDRAFTPNIMAGLRVGYALFGGPPAITNRKGTPDPADDSKIAFLPFHAELRLSYWFGRGALGKKGLRPYVFLGGGMAQVDAKVPVTVYDCSKEEAKMAPAPANCRTGVAVENGGPNQLALDQKKLDAWKKLGQGFAAAGGGLVFAFKEQIGVQLNVNGMYMLGSSGPVIEPSLGFVYGL